MDISSELLFFFSLIGVFNGLLLSFYLLFFTKEKNAANLYLGLLLLAVSIRIGKSVIFFFHNDLASVFLKIGLSACVCIGPLLYLFVVSVVKNKEQFEKKDLLHFISSVILIGIFIWAPYYKDDLQLWRNIIMPLIKYQWLSYILISAYLLIPVFKEFSSNKSKKYSDALLLVSVFVGVSVIWVAFFAFSFTSYILGAVCFTFIVYIFGVLVILHKIKKNNMKSSRQEKPKLADQQLKEIELQLNQLLGVEKLFKDSQLKLPALAKKMNISTHQLSQFINDELQKNFSQLINEYRIEEAKALLKSEENLTMEAISYDCGFNSTSTFYTEFKKQTQLTPATFRKQYMALK